MTRVALLTLGCKLNYAETSTYGRGFREAGCEVVSWRDKADVYLVNTCSVTATSDAKSRGLIRKVHRLNPEARIVVTGCSAQLRRREMEGIEGVWRVFGACEKHLVVPETLGLPCPSEPQVFAAWSSGERTRCFLKVQDGCDNRCLYCTVPYARGASRNVPVCECVRMARDAAAEGIREIVITGVNTGDFGRTTGESFLDLLGALQDVGGIERYRISSIEPNLLTDDIIGFTAAEGSKFQPHFHIPLQTGCDELLAKMGRRYDTAFFADRITKVRRAFEGPGKPDVFFGIDVMCGLPGETDAMFERTLRFIGDIRPAFIHVFPYSRRPGTPAAQMSGQVDEAVKADRVARMEALSSSLHDDFVRKHRGTVARVLFESREKDGTMSGYTGNYIKVSRPYDPALVGRVTEVTI